MRIKSDGIHGSLPVRREPAKIQRRTDEQNVPLRDDVDTTPIKFGQYYGCLPVEVAEGDPGYLVWLANTRQRLVCSVKLLGECRQRLEHNPALELPAIWEQRVASVHSLRDARISAESSLSSEERGRIISTLHEQYEEHRRQMEIIRLQSRVSQQQRETAARTHEHRQRTAQQRAVAEVAGAQKMRKQRPQHRKRRKEVKIVNPLGKNRKLIR